MLGMGISVGIRISTEQSSNIIPSINKNFVILYDTRNSDPNNSIIHIPLSSGYEYNFEWELRSQTGHKIDSGHHITIDGTDLYVDAITPDKYIFKILYSESISSFQKLSSSGVINKENWLEIQNWGKHEIKNMFSSFRDYSNLKITALDYPILDLECETGMFTYTFSNIAEENFIANFPLGIATELYGTFSYGKWINFPYIDTSKIEVFRYTWYKCYDLETIGLVDTSNAVSVEGMNMNCYKLTHGNHGSLVSCSSIYSVYRNCYEMASYNDIDSMILTDGRYAFWNAGITAHKLFYTGLITTASAMFRFNKVTNFPDYDWSELYYSDWAFAENYYLIDNPYPVMSFPKAKYMSNMFYANGSMSGGFKTISFSSPSVVDMTGMFRYSRNLLEINCDFTTAVSCSYAFYDCRSLGVLGSDFDFRTLNLINAEDLTETFNLNLTTGVNGMSTTRYSELLIWFEANNVKDNVPLGAGNTTYNSSAVSARNALIARGWTITDGGLE